MDISNLFSIFKRKEDIKERKYIKDDYQVQRKNVYEKIEQIELEIESKLDGLELTDIEINKLEAFKEKYKILKEEATKQVIREKNKDNIELYLKDCNYYQETLNELLELLDASLAKYTFLKRLKVFTIDNDDISISIKEIFYLRNDYISLNTLFNEEEKDNIEEYLSNIYFDIILREIKSFNDSSLFKELTLIEKKKVQLVLIKKIKENISKTKFRKEHLEELINNIFSLDDFRVYLKLIYKYNNKLGLVKVK